MLVFYHGGEPLLNKNLDIYIREVREFYSGGIKLVTNGKLLSEEWTLRLLLAGVDLIEVSLDGISGSESDAIRKRSSYSDVLVNIKRSFQQARVLGKGQRVEVATTQFVDDYKIDSSPVPPAPIPKWLIAELGKEIRIKATWAVQWPGRYPVEGSIAFREEAPSMEYPSCNLLDETVTVRANGDVVVCCYDLTSLHIIGNIHESSLEELWISDEYESFRNGFDRGKFQEPCKSCSVTTGRAFLAKETLLIGRRAD